MAEQKDKIECAFEDWDDTTLPHPVCHCLKREGIDCAIVPDGVEACPDFMSKKDKCPECNGTGMGQFYFNKNAHCDTCNGTGEKVMFKRYNKYEVMKLDDINKYLSPAAQLELQFIINTLQAGRKVEGKVPCNSYVVVNADEPYAEQVWALIQRHCEGKKLDSPGREKIAKLIRSVVDDDYECESTTDQITTLIPTCDCCERPLEVDAQKQKIVDAVKEAKKQGRREVIKEIEKQAGETLFLLEDLKFWHALKEEKEETSA